MRTECADQRWWPIQSTNETQTLVQFLAGVDGDTTLDGKDEGAAHEPHDSQVVTTGEIAAAHNFAGDRSDEAGVVGHGPWTGGRVNWRGHRGQRGQSTCAPSGACSKVRARKGPAGAGNVFVTNGL